MPHQLFQSFDFKCIVFFQGLSKQRCMRMPYSSKNDMSAMIYRYPVQNRYSYAVRNKKTMHYHLKSSDQNDFNTTYKYGIYIMSINFRLNRGQNNASLQIHLDLNHAIEKYGKYTRFQKYVCTF